MNLRSLTNNNIYDFASTKWKDTKKLLNHLIDKLMQKYEMILTNKCFVKQKGPLLPRLVYFSILG